MKHQIYANQENFTQSLVVMVLTFGRPDSPMILNTNMNGQKLRTAPFFRHFFNNLSIAIMGHTFCESLSYMQKKNTRSVTHKPFFGQEFNGSRKTYITRTNLITFYFLNFIVVLCIN